MYYDEILDNFYKKFISFETKDGSFNFDNDNTNFNIKKWIDELRDQLIANDGQLSKDVINSAKNTAYLEFEYAWNYVSKQLRENNAFLTWTRGVGPKQEIFYELQTLSTFIFSLLNRMTMIHHILENIDYLEQVRVENLKTATINMNDSIKDKLKRVTFNNWRYNPLIKEYENSALWKHFLLDARNVSEHYGVLVKVGSIDALDEESITFYPELIIEIYFFLFYLNKYVKEFEINKHNY